MQNILKIFWVALIIFGCSTSDDSNPTPNPIPPFDETLYFPPINSSTWETESLNDLNWDSNALTDLLTFVEEKNSESFIILKNGKIVVEWYGNGASASSNHTWNSASKTLAAFTIGIAEQAGLLDVNDSSKDYLGEGWSSLSPEQENAITVRHHLTMTTGIDYEADNSNCTDPDCLVYLNEPGTFWYYDNATYTLTHRIIEGASGKEFKTYFNEELRNKIGMQGAWITLGYFELYASNARSMARYGILCLNKGKWEDEQILNESFFNEMTTTSQNLNKSYGYFWWLNGKESFHLPSTVQEFTGPLFPSAPSDLISSLGKDDQKVYVVPSENLVVVRMGDSADESNYGPSSFDSQLWEKITALYE